MDPMSIIGGVSALTGLFGRRSRAPRMSYEDIDPNRYAEKRFRELTDPNSAYNRGQYNNLLRMSLSASPSLDALLGAQSASGGSASIAQAQARANTGRAREAAFNAYEGQRGQTEGLAQGYLGMHQDIGKMVAGSNFGAQMAEYQDNNSFANSMIGLGGGMLGMSLLGNGDPEASAYTPTALQGGAPEIASYTAPPMQQYQHNTRASLLSVARPTFGVPGNGYSKNAVIPSGFREGLNYGPTPAPNKFKSFRARNRGFQAPFAM